jgi:transposase
VPNFPAIVAEVLRELRRTPELRYAHRLHGVLLIAHGFAYRTVATLLGDAPRTLAYWWRRYREAGMTALREPPPHGRHRRLTDSQIKEIAVTVRQPPAAASIPGARWTGATLAQWIERQYGIRLGPRQAQRILHDLAGPSQQPPGGDKP